MNVTHRDAVTQTKKGETRTFKGEERRASGLSRVIKNRRCNNE